jgi:oxygen-independent coproporphyrinogen III oxidase
MNQTTALYIHIPFCKKICPFCDFTKQKTNNKLFKPYLKALKKELCSYSTENIIISTIYFGGGTPSTIPENLIKDLLTYIKDTFDIKKEIEISFEMNPEDVTLPYITKIKRTGINRISIGVQSFHDNECTILGRNHNTKTTYNALNIIKNEITNFNIDLMFALPNSTINSLDFSLNKAIEYNPTHISCYSLTIEPNTPYYKNKVNKSKTPEDTKQYSHIIKKLKESNYKQYEISSFSKSNYECTHNKHYWNFNDYIGIGTGAHSLYKNKKFKKTSNMREYINNPHEYEITCNTKEDLISENIISNLRRIKGLRFTDYKTNYNLEFKSHFFNTLELLQKHKMIKLNTLGFYLTKKGLYLLDDVCLLFL